MSYHDKDYYAVTGAINAIDNAQTGLAAYIIGAIQDRNAEKQEAEQEGEMYWHEQYNNLLGKHNALVEEFNAILAVSRARMANLEAANQNTITASQRLEIYKQSFEEARNLAYRHASLVALLGEHLEKDLGMDLNKVMEGAIKHLPEIRQTMPDDPKAVYNWWAAPEKLENREAFVEFIPTALKPDDFDAIDKAEEIKGTI